MPRHYFLTDESRLLSPAKLEEIARSLEGTDEDLYVALGEAGVDPNDPTVLTLAGVLPGLPVRQCPDCGYWYRGRRSECKDCRN